MPDACASFQDIHATYERCIRQKQLLLHGPETTPRWRAVGELKEWYRFLALAINMYRLLDKEAVYIGDFIRVAFQHRRGTVFNDSPM